MVTSSNDQPSVSLDEIVSDILSVRFGFYPRDTTTIQLRLKPPNRLALLPNLATMDVSLIHLQVLVFIKSLHSVVIRPLEKEYSMKSVYNG